MPHENHEFRLVKGGRRNSRSRSSSESRHRKRKSKHERYSKSRSRSRSHSKKNLKKDSYYEDRDKHYEDHRKKYQLEHHSKYPQENQSYRKGREENYNKYPYSDKKNSEKFENSRNKFYDQDKEKKLTKSTSFQDNNTSFQKKKNSQNVEIEKKHIRKVSSPSRSLSKQRCGSKQIMKQKMKIESEKNEIVQERKDIPIKESIPQKEEKSQSQSQSQSQNSKKSFLNKPSYFPPPPPTSQPKNESSMNESFGSHISDKRSENVSAMNQSYENKSRNWMGASTSNHFNSYQNKSSFPSNNQYPNNSYQHPNNNYQHPNNNYQHPTNSYQYPNNNSQYQSNNQPQNNSQYQSNNQPQSNSQYQNNIQYPAWKKQDKANDFQPNKYPEQIKYQSFHEKNKEKEVPLAKRKNQQIKNESILDQENSFSKKNILSENIISNELELPPKKQVLTGFALKIFEAKENLTVKPPKCNFLIMDTFKSMNKLQAETLDPKWLAFLKKEIENQGFRSDWTKIIDKSNSVDQTNSVDYTSNTLEDEKPQPESIHDHKLYLWIRQKITDEDREFKEKLEEFRKIHCGLNEMMRKLKFTPS